MEGTDDPRNPTGEIEVLIEEAKVLNRSKAIPFEVAEQKNSMLPGEDLRLKYRYLDLRRKEMIANLRFRIKVISSARRLPGDGGFHGGGDTNADPQQSRKAPGTSWYRPGPCPGSSTLCRSRRSSTSRC